MMSKFLGFNGLLHVFKNLHQNSEKILVINFYRSIYVGKLRGSPSNTAYVIHDNGVKQNSNSAIFGHGSETTVRL